MKIAKFGIEGVMPLLMNRFYDESLETPGGARPKKDKTLTAEEDARKTAYIDEKGVLYLPSLNVFACIIEGGKYEKIGKSKVTTIKSSMVPAGVKLVEEKLSLNTKKFEVDTRSVVIPSTGGRIIKHRAILKEWALEGTLEIDEKIFTPEFVKRLLENAGSYIGLGDYRPQRKGPFGKFKVVKFEVKHSKN